MWGLTGKGSNAESRGSGWTLAGGSTLFGAAQEVPLTWNSKRRLPEKNRNILWNIVLL